jgi:ADP-heptose:LPS heptosyltransferase
VLTALRERYPSASITWVVNRGYESLLVGHPDLDRTLPFDRQAAGSSFASMLRGYGAFLRKIRAQRFDLVVDLQGLFRSGLMAAATGAARRVGLSTAREGACWFYTDIIKVADFNAIHAVDRYWLVAEALAAGDGTKRFRVPVSEAARAWATDALSGRPRPWLVIGPGSRWHTKRWSPPHFAALVRQAQERFGGTAILIGAPDEQDVAIDVAGLLRGPVCNLAGRTSLEQLAGILEQADVMLANDTGPLHLAAALGRPVVAPYTCTRVLLNGPYGAEANAVETRVWCQGSYLKSCPRLDCMAELTPDRLWHVLERVLLAWEKGRRSA